MDRSSAFRIDGCVALPSGTGPLLGGEGRTAAASLPSAAHTSLPRSRPTAIEQGLPLRCLSAAPPSLLTHATHAALRPPQSHCNCLAPSQWHLTGIELESEEDPASEEHFGISVAEGGWKSRWPRVGCSWGSLRSAAEADNECDSACPLLHCNTPGWTMAGQLPLSLKGGWPPGPRRPPPAVKAILPDPAAGMSSGVIPVVLNRGGVGDIVKHGHNGFLAPTAQVGRGAGASLR